MKKVIHEIIANVESGSCSVRPPVDIHQGDSNTHLLLFKLKDSRGRPVPVDENGEIKISFSKQDSKNLISYTAEIVNAYRGEVSYLVGPAVVQEFGRYTVCLDFSNCETYQYSTISFVIVVSKCHNYNPEDYDVTISKQFVEELQEHVADTDIHMDKSDQYFVRSLRDSTDELKELVSTGLDEKVLEVVLKESEVILKKSFITVDYLTDLPTNINEVCEGKLARVNYPNSDNPDEGCKYYVCSIVDSNVSWKEYNVGNTEEIEEKLKEHQQEIDKLYQLVSQIDMQGLLQRMDSAEENIDDLQRELDNLKSDLDWKSL